MRYYLSGGRLILIELKVKGGKLSDVQVKRHKVLGDLGFTVHVIYADCPVDGWNQVRGVLGKEGTNLREYYDAGVVKKD